MKDKSLRLPLLMTETFAEAKRVAPRFDVYALEREWREWMASTNQPKPKNPDAAFLAFCRKKLARQAAP